ncbi:hypothetical protein DFJ74DRAFT_676185 [Hyaloraphidium curvatum]|nr:hypothetical protein DFJ74DRAFT_676185 [Hyaloraphidium curvatum]
MLPLNAQPISNNEQAAAVQCSAGYMQACGYPSQLTQAPGNLLNSACFESGGDGNGNSWVQMAGSLNGGASVFAPGDSGGQYDSDGMPDPSDPSFRGSPSGGSCYGWDDYVELLGPEEGDYCIRCCSGPATDTYCDWTNSGQSCSFVFPGINMC